MTQQSKYRYYRAYVPKRTSLATLARMACPSLVVEEDLQQAKEEVGLDQYEVSRWDAWHRHVTLGLLAHAALQVSRARSESEGDRQGPL
jgi:SRSO17 transposase